MLGTTFKFFSHSIGNCLNMCAMSKMLGGFDEKRYAIVIGIAQEHTSTARCLKICDSWSNRNEEPFSIFGRPCYLHCTAMTASSFGKTGTLEETVLNLDRFLK